jgi:hypothetical protein
MSKAARKRKNKMLKEQQFYSFHQQAQAVGGLMDLHLFHRREAAAWMVAAIHSEKARGIMNAVDNLLSRWDRDGAGMLCATCDNSVERLDDVSAFGFLAPYGRSKAAMTLPLCRECADGPDLQTRILVALRKLAWPNIRVAPPVHTKAGRA